MKLPNKYHAAPAFKLSLSTLAVLSALATLGGCAQPSPRYDAVFGDTVRVAIAQQTINPDAAKNLAPVTVDGRAGREAIERYQKSFKEPTPHSNVFTIGLGGGSGGQ
jgi:hypothetical protein